jgi:hypothetical protein
LEPSLLKLGLWGAPLLATQHQGEALQPHWLKAQGGTIDVRLGIPESSAAVLSGAPDIILGMLAGRITVSEGTANGVSLQGSVATVRRVIPHIAAKAVRLWK